MNNFKSNIAISVLLSVAFVTGQNRHEILFHMSVIYSAAHYLRPKKK